MEHDLKAELLESILSADMVQARKSILTGIERYDRAGVVTELLEPVLTRIGELWESEVGGISLAQGYLAAKVAEDVLIRIAPENNGKGDKLAPKRPAVIGNIEDDFHSLGRKMVVTFMRAAGWDVVDLGNDVPAKEFVDRALEVGAKVIGASAMTFSNAANIKHLRNEIDGRGLTGRIQLAVGGAVFLLRPELVEDVGGNGTAKNAIAAPDLFERLWKEAEKIQP